MHDFIGLCLILKSYSDMLSGFRGLRRILEVVTALWRSQQDLVGSSRSYDFREMLAGFYRCQQNYGALSRILEYGTQMFQWFKRMGSQKSLVGFQKSYILEVSIMQQNFRSLRIVEVNWILKVLTGFSRILKVFAGLSRIQQGPSDISSILRRIQQDFRGLNRVLEVFAGLGRILQVFAGFSRALAVLVVF